LPSLNVKALLPTLFPDLGSAPGFSDVSHFIILTEILT
jgi:hypothetical protein